MISDRMPEIDLSVATARVDVIIVKTRQFEIMDVPTASSPGSNLHEFSGFNDILAKLINLCSFGPMDRRRNPYAPGAGIQPRHSSAETSFFSKPRSTWSAFSPSALLGVSCSSAYEGSARLYS